MSDTGTSVLAKLTSEVMESKKTAARQLTPVEGEDRDVLPRTPAMFPNDMPQEVITQKADELTRIIGHLTQARDALYGLVEKAVPTEPVDIDAARKAKEADADFNASFRAQQLEAQKSVYPNDVANDEVIADVVSGWACPTHGKSTQKKSVKTGRDYIGCPDCNLFKR